MGICFLSDAFQTALIKKKGWHLWTEGCGEVWAVWWIAAECVTMYLEAGQNENWVLLSSTPILPPLLSSSGSFSLQPFLKFSPYRKGEETRPPWRYWGPSHNSCAQILLCHAEEWGETTGGVFPAHHKRCISVRWSISVMDIRLFK